MSNDVTITPFKRLTLLQTKEDMENVDCQFGTSSESDGSFLECQDCQSTNIVFRTIIEADMTVNIYNSVVDMSNEKVQAVRVVMCSRCHGTNIERTNFIKPVKEETKKRLVPRYTK